MLAQVALGVVESGKKGKLVITLDLDQIGDSAQLMVSHKVVATKPTLLGKLTEEEQTSTPLYTNTKGFLSVSPDVQVDMYSANKEELP